MLLVAVVAVVAAAMSIFDGAAPQLSHPTLLLCGDPPHARCMVVVTVSPSGSISGIGDGEVRVLRVRRTAWMCRAGGSTSTGRK